MTRRIGISRNALLLALAFLAAPACAYAQDETPTETAGRWLGGANEGVQAFGKVGNLLVSVTAKSFVGAGTGADKRALANSWNNALQAWKGTADATKGSLAYSVAPAAFVVSDIATSVVAPAMEGDGSGAVNAGVSSLATAEGAAVGAKIFAVAGGAVGSFFPVVGTAAGTVVGGAKAIAGFSADYGRASLGGLDGQMKAAGINTGAGWRYLLGTAVFVMPGAGQKKSLVIFYNPWVDSALFTLWQPVGKGRKIVDAAWVPGDLVRKARAQIDPQPLWLRGKGYPLGGLSQRHLPAPRGQGHQERPAAGAPGDGHGAGQPDFLWLHQCPGEFLRQRGRTGFHGRQRGGLHPAGKAQAG